ncbi:MAG: uncharacterized protein JWM21_2706 [Acidobacteria bacterium]|nr:uncharacterized protein [Acidobacteriota bacterium]
MDRFVERSLDQLDYLAVSPDRAWIDNGLGSANRFEPLPLMAALLDEAARELPIVLHGVGLSICSAEIFDKEYAQNLIDWANRLGSPWISEHLSFSRIGLGHEVNSAVALPVPYDEESLNLLIPRVRFLTDTLSCPFLLENNVYYFNYLEQTFSEGAFLNELCRQTGCSVLLDLHNLYTNAVNHSFDALEYINELNLENVREIHVAGGVRMMGFHTDSHTGPVLDSVWELLEHTVPLTPNLQGVTFEFHESSFGRLGEEGILEQVEHARSIVNNHVTASLSASSR